MKIQKVFFRKLGKKIASLGNFVGKIRKKVGSLGKLTRNIRKVRGETKKNWLGN